MSLAASGLARRLGPGGLLTTEADLAAYSYDGALDKRRPDAVVVAFGAAETFDTVSWCVREGISVVARGAGTNLSGGCIPTRGGIVLSLARMTRILSVD